MKRKFWRKSLSLMLSTAFVVTSIPGMAFVSEAAVDIIVPPTPIYQYDFEDTLAEKDGKATAVAKQKNLESNYEGVITYDTGRDGSGKSVYLNGAYGLDLSLPQEGRTSDYSISFWANPQNNMGWADSLINWGVRKTGNDNWISVAGNGVWSAIDNKNTDMVGYERTNNEWQQYVISVEGNKATIYRNGVPGNSLTVSTTAFTNESSTLCLGINAWDNNANCKFDEVKVFDKALTAAEVKYLYNGEETIAISGDSANKVVGQEFELNASVVGVEEGAQVTWKSSDESIATVAGDGMVTCVGEGTVEITASVPFESEALTSAPFTFVVDPANMDAYVNAIADFTFDDAETGFTGAGAKAVAGNGAIADMVANVDDKNVLQLEKANSEFLNVVKEDDSSLLTGVEDMKVSFDWKTSASASDWPFFAAPDTNVQQYQQEHYIGVITDGQKKVTVQRYNGGPRQPSIAGDIESNVWKHIDVIFSKTSIILYVDNVKAGSVSNPFALSEILGETSVIQLGKANWGSGEYSNGYMDNFTISVRTDKTALQSAVAGAVSEEEKDKYTEESWTRYTEILNDAKEKLEAVGTTQTDADTAAETLNAAKTDVLVEKPVVEPEPAEDIRQYAEATSSIDDVYQYSQGPDTLKDNIVDEPFWNGWWQTTKEGWDTASQWFMYDFGEMKAEISACKINWFDNSITDDGGVITPTEITIEYADEGGEWKEVTPDGEAWTYASKSKDDPADVYGFNAVETNKIRVTIKTHGTSVNFPTKAPAAAFEWYLTGKMLPAEGTPVQDPFELVASYDMSQAEGELTDVSGNGHDATYVGYEEADFTTEENDAVLTFTGDANKYVKIPSGIITGEKFAVEATFKTNTIANSWLWCLGTKVASLPNVFNYVFVSPRFENDVIRAGIKDGESEVLFSDITDKLQDDTYTRLRVEFDNGNMKLFKDGNIISTLETDYSIQEILTAGTNAEEDFCGYIGKSLYAPDPAFTGTLTQFDIYTTREEEPEAPVNTEELEAAIAAVPADSEEYEKDDAWDAYWAKVEEAETLLEKEGLTQDEVTEMVEALTALKNALTPASSEEPVIPEVLADFNFDTDGEFFDGGYAKATGDYDLADHGTGKALKLNGTDQFLTVTDKEGASLLTGVEEMTISYQINPSSSRTNWGFFAAPNANTQEYEKEHYIGIVDIEGTTKAERYNGGPRPVTAEYGTGYNGWYHVTVVHTQNATKLYVNGEIVAEEPSTFKLPEILGDNSILYIGKSTWVNGEYATATIDNYKIYSKALTDEEIAAEAAKYVEKDALKAAIDTKVDAENTYTSTTWKAYADALAKAGEVYLDDEATQTEINDAAAELKSAISKLTKRGDKTELKAAIAAAIPDADKDKYTTESWEAYQTALAKAKEVDADADAVQRTVDAALNALEKAQGALEPAAADPVTLPFVDVAEDDWFYDGVYYNYANHIVEGKDETHFAPYENLARAQFAVILHRIEGKPAAKGNASFPDVQSGQWYTDAVLWAADKEVGIIQGYTDSGLFGTADNITREQMAVMMYRYAEYKGYSLTADGTFDTFTDGDKVTAFAVEAMKWAVGNGIITGKDLNGDGTLETLDPQGNTSRAECAIIVQRFMEKIAK